MGTVYFLTGLSGAGKTTLGGMLYEYIRRDKLNVILLDGDRIRPVYLEDIGYSEEDRRKGAKRTFRICKMLAEQGIDVVVCSICMYDEVRQWNRDNISDYVEIYIKVKKDTLIKRNQKGLYVNSNNVVGMDLEFEEPKTPDIILENDGELSANEVFNKLINYLNSR